MILLVVLFAVIWEQVQCALIPAHEFKLNLTHHTEGEILALHSIGTVGNKKYYMENGTTRDWYDARDYCEAAGPYIELATVEDWQEYNFLHGIDFGKEYAVFWTGGRDVQEVSSRFLWNPASDQPAYFPRFDVLTANVENCMVYSVSEADGRIYVSRSCYDEYNILCQEILNKK